MPASMLDFLVCFKNHQGENIKYGILYFKTKVYHKLIAILNAMFKMFWLYTENDLAKKLGSVTDLEFKRIIKQVP